MFYTSLGSTHQLLKEHRFSFLKAIKQWKWGLPLLGETMLFKEVWFQIVIHEMIQNKMGWSLKLNFRSWKYWHYCLLDAEISFVNCKLIIVVLTSGIFGLFLSFAYKKLWNWFPVLFFFFKPDRPYRFFAFFAFKSLLGILVLPRIFVLMKVLL